jgi:hypothetical protein
MVWLLTDKSDHEMKQIMGEMSLTDIFVHEQAEDGLG